MDKSLEELYNEVNFYLNKVDFKQIWDGFKPLKFALYNETECYFNGSYIEKTDVFLANTAIKFNDEIIAIWNVMDESSMTSLASKIAHEMFHAYQMSNNEIRFPNERDALYNYKYSDENLKIKLVENNLIVELNEEFNIDKYNLLLGLRKYRYNNFNYEFIYEAQIEQIEGCANFVELNVLKQLSNEEYNHKLKQMKELITKPENLFPIRIISYDIGALFLNILYKNNIEYHIDFTDTTIFEEVIKDVKERYISECKSIKDYIEKYHNESKDIIEKALTKNDVIFDGCEKLLGINIYDARCMDDYIISKFFVMYGKKETPTIKYGDFVIEMKGNNVVKIYKM